jgi:iron complex outermembrane recepter protein
MRRFMRNWLLISVLLSTADPARSWSASLDLTELSLEDLLEIEVTSVSRKPEQIHRAAAAVAAITRDDIRRAGVTSIPEALRLVPGVQVAHFDANKWAISIRGFNGLFANKLLVLVDGRSKYNTMYSGVLWETLDLPLDDVERIEVIRGPGATLWGANAVNGVINIITRPAADTPGLRLHTHLGDPERGAADLRYGGRLPGNGHYRLYARYFDRDSSADAIGEDAADAWNALRTGFRVDLNPQQGRAVTLQGDLYRGAIGETIDLAAVEPPFTRTLEANSHFWGGHLLGRWERALSATSDIKLQFYYDRAGRDDTPLLIGYFENFDFDFQQQLRYGDHQALVWGLGYRLTHDDLDSDFGLIFHSPRRTYHLFSAFVQNDLELVPERLRLTLGSKFEHNSFSGFEIQPDLRLLWTPRPRHTLWSAISRAVRTPSRADHDIGVITQALPAGSLGPDTPLAFVVASGARTFAAEKMLACEVGYRLRPADRFFLDLATFYYLYEDLRTYRAGLPFLSEQPSPTHLVLPMYQANDMSGETFGAELTADWLVDDGWHLRATYSFLQMRLRVEQGGENAEAARAIEGESPPHQFTFHSSRDFPGGLQLDGDLRYVDELSSLQVDGYLEADLRIGWRPKAGVEFSIVGRNLLHPHHPEYRSVGIPFVVTEVRRGAHGALTLSF